MSQKEITQSIEAWNNYCDTLKVAGKEILAAAQNADQTTSAEGLRYLTRLVRAGLEKFVEYGDPTDPTIYPVFDEKTKWGGDNPESIYLVAVIDGRHTYELSGNRGTVAYFNITAASMPEDGKLTAAGYLDHKEVTIDQEGNFRLLLSSKVASHSEYDNTLIVDETCNMLMVRQTFNDRQNDQPMQLSLKCLSAPDNISSLKLAPLRDSLEKAAGFFAKTGKTFVELSQAMAKDINTLPPVDKAYIDSIGGDPNYTYFWSAFQLEPNQALLVHLPTIPECETWSLCLYNYWLESLDYHKANIIYNKHTAKPNSDGSVTMIVSAADPGVANWLNSCDHISGNLIFRWTKAPAAIRPLTQVVELNAAPSAEYHRRWESATEGALL